MTNFPFSPSRRVNIIIRLFIPPSPHTARSIDNIVVRAIGKKCITQSRVIGKIFLYSYFADLFFNSAYSTVTLRLKWLLASVNSARNKVVSHWLSIFLWVLSHVSHWAFHLLFHSWNSVPKLIYFIPESSFVVLT